MFRVPVLYVSMVPPLQILVMGYQEIKLEWPEVPRIKLKLLFICHLILISWSSLGEQTRERCR